MAAISKEEYLKRYLSGDTNSEKKKKKKKVKPVKQTNVRIIDDDIDLKTIGASAANEQEQSDDEAPTIAEIVDERPEHVKRLEQYRKDQRWKVMGKDKEEDDISSAGYGVITSADRPGKGQKATQRQRHDSDSDASPPRRKRHDSDSDPSPPRKRRHDSDSDASPPRKKRHDSDSDNSPARRKRHDSDSDNSPPRKNKPSVETSASDKNSRKGQNRQSRFAPADPPARRKRHDSDSDHSPPRKQRHDSDSDQSPPRKGAGSDQSPPRRKRHDSDESPPRKRKPGKESDQSPPRRKRHDSNSDQSPPRQRKRGREDDQSPPRRQSEGKKGAKPEKTLGGAKAGLSSAAEMKREAELLRKKEDENFKKIEREALGRDAQTVFRDKSGKRRNLAAEQEEEAKEAKKKAEEDKKYQEWGQGLKQKEQREQLLQDYVHEASKPLARYKDDEDLDRIMREMDREGDPMAMFMKKKTKKEDPNAKPRYKGPPPPPNRFGIMPGYRWDGVDRSNGFEKQIFTKMSEKKAVKEHAYKWSTEDM